MGHTSFQMNRRAFLRAGAGSAAALAIGPQFLKQAFAAGPLSVGPGPYGALGSFDGNGISLPAGFTSREIARGGSNVPASGGVPFAWHPNTDGQATFPTLGPGGGPDGGWILVANSEFPATGGVSAVEFAADGQVEQAQRILANTTLNCAGGPTPWGTWLSCEEFIGGQVHECDPTTLNVGVARPAMGLFSHEAACVDPTARRLYMTEDQPDGCIYRFTPTNYPDLSAGLLEVAVGSAPGVVGWLQVPNPAGGGVQPTRNQVAGAVRFNGGEGMWFDKGTVYFTTKGDSRVWTLNTTTNQVEILYDDDAVAGAPLTGVDNVTVSQSGDVYVCEDSRDNDICLITPEMKIARFLTLNPAVHGAAGTNENVGVVFNPAGDRMYFGVQRSFTSGVVYEISGPFRKTSTKAAGKFKLTAARRKSMRRFLKKGFVVKLDIDGPLGIDAKLTIQSKNKKGRKSRRLIGTAKPSVALDNLVDLQLKPSKGAGRLLRNRKQVTALLEVVGTDSAGTKTTLAQNAKLVRSAGRKKRKPTKR